MKLRLSLLSFVLLWIVLSLFACTRGQDESTPTIPAISPTYPQLSTVPPPTLTPPALVVFGTPTPTPLPEQAQLARQFVATQKNISLETVLFEWNAPVVHPHTGETLWVSNLRDMNTGKQYFVSIDAQSQVSFLPDLSSQGLASVSERENIPIEQLTIVNRAFSVFQFTKQVVWQAKIDDTLGHQTYGITLNLAGEPVDLPALKLAEETATQAQCQKLDQGLCASLLDKPFDYPVFVHILLKENADPTPLLQQLGDQYEYIPEYRHLTAELTKQEVFDLAPMPEIHQIWWGIVTHFPLDKHLLLAFEEVSGQLSLKLQTREEYGCANMLINSELATPVTQKIEILIHGVDQDGEGCLASMAPAIQTLSLGVLNGTYELTLTYENFQDSYWLTVTPEIVALEPITQSFTWGQYPSWLRLPPDTIWLYVFAQEQNIERTPIAPDQVSYNALVAEFFTKIEQLGAEPFVPTPGIYSNANFVFPWPEWWSSLNERTVIPIDYHSFHLLKWPVVRYFYFRGDLQQVNTFVQTFNTTHEIATGWGRTWNGAFIPLDE